MREHFSQTKLNQIQAEIKELSEQIAKKQDELKVYRRDYRFLDQDYALKEKDLLRSIPSDDQAERKKHIDAFYAEKNRSLSEALEKINKADDEHESLQKRMSYLKQVEFEEGAKLVPTYDEYAHPERQQQEMLRRQSPTTVPLTNPPTWTKSNQAMTKSFTTDHKTLEKTASELRADVKVGENQIEYRLANHQTARLDLKTNTIYLNDLSDGSLRDSAALFKASGMNTIDISNLQGQAKSNMWLASRLANLEVTGYTPNSADEAKLSSQQQPISGPSPHP